MRAKVLVKARCRRMKVELQLIRLTTGKLALSMSDDDDSSDMYLTDAQARKIHAAIGAHLKLDMLRHVKQSGQKERKC